MPIPRHRGSHAPNASQELPSSASTIAPSSAWMRHERELILIGSGNLTLFGQRSSKRPLSDGAFPSALKQRPICPMAYNSAARYDRALHARRHQHHQGRRERADQKRRKAYSRRSRKVPVCVSVMRSMSYKVSIPKRQRRARKSTISRGII
jgi:hypothetical protein